MSDINIHPTEPPGGYDFQTAPIVHEWPEVRGLRALVCASEIAPGAFLLCVENRATGERREILRVFGQAADDSQNAVNISRVVHNTLEAAAPAWLGDTRSWQ